MKRSIFLLACPVAVSVVACDKAPSSSSTSSPAVSASAASTAAATPEPIATALAAGPTSDSSGAPVGDFASGETGTIGTKSTAAELVKSGDTIEGAYTYSPSDIGYPIALHGTVSSDRVVLTETTGKKTTGKIVATLAKDGALTGTWSSPDGKSSAPVSWNVSKTLGRPSGVSVLFAAIHIDSTEPPNDVVPVGSQHGSGGMYVVDRRTANVVVTKLKDQSFEVHGACTMAQPVTKKDETWSIDPNAVQAAFVKAFPGEKLLSSDVAIRESQRAAATYSASFVTAAADGKSLHVRAWDAAAPEPPTFKDKPAVDKQL